MNQRTKRFFRSRSSTVCTSTPTTCQWLRKTLKAKKKEAFLPVSVMDKDDRRLNSQMVFSSERNKPNLILLKKHFEHFGLLKEDCALNIVTQATAILQKQPTIKEVNAPVIIFGDIHGYYDDMIKTMSTLPLPTNKQYIFLGDYVDRGPSSCEVILYLFSLLICYPTTVHLLRGNHETTEMCSVSAFIKECKIKYSETFFNQVTNAFAHLPLALVVKGNIQGDILCVHAGIGPKMTHLEQLKTVTKTAQLMPDVVDLLWSDPVSENKSCSMTQYCKNTGRGISVYYGKSAVEKFLSKNRYVTIVRGHQAFQDGYCQHTFGVKDRPIPFVFTIFSAPGYCMYKNKGAIMDVSVEKIKIQTFKSVSTRVVFPGNADVFSATITPIKKALNDLIKWIMSGPKKLTSPEKKEDKVLKAKLKNFYKRLNTKHAQIRSISTIYSIKYHPNIKLLTKQRNNPALVKPSLSTPTVIPIAKKRKRPTFSTCATPIAQSLQTNQPEIITSELSTIDFTISKSPKLLKQQTGSSHEKKARKRSVQGTTEGIIPIKTERKSEGKKLQNGSAIESIKPMSPTKLAKQRSVASIK
ncbi:serine/threonine protein phosphatase 2B catalytic subunit alpha isoform [Entamoeba marina]